MQLVFWIGIYLAGKEPETTPEDPDLIEMGWGKASVKVKEEEKAPQKATHAAQKPTTKPVPEQPADEGYNHRKAAMALLRLRRNQNRMAALPDGTDDDGARKLLKDHGGNVDEMIESAKHMVFKETAEKDTETTTPLTEFQDCRCFLLFQCFSLLARFPRTSPERCCRCTAP